MIRILLGIALLGTTTMKAQAQSRIRGMGQNNYHQLGSTAAANPQMTPVVLMETNPAALSWTYIASEAASSLALKEDGSLWAWGRNNDGQLGDSTTTTVQAPKRISRGTGFHGKWIMVDIGGSHALGIREDGSLWAWGSGTYGKLGLGQPYNDTLYPVLVDSGTGPHGKWIVAEAGLSHSLALRTDGTLWTWGNNANGQLGLATDTISTRDRPVLADSGTNWGGRFVQLSATANHTLAVKENGSLWAWGWNQYKQVGHGNTVAEVNRIRCIDSAANGRWLQVSAGYYHNIALRADSTLWAWGRNNNNQLGNGNTTTLAYMMMIDSGTSGNHGKWIKIEAGHSFNLGIRADSTFWAWGQNTNGQLGDGTTVNIPLITHIPALDGLIDPLIRGGQGHTLILERLPATDTTDIGVSNLLISGTGAAGTSHTITLTIKNRGTVPVIDPVLAVTVNNSMLVSDTLSGILAPGATQVHAFSIPWMPVAEGAYTVCGYAVQQEYDTFAANDTACIAFDVAGSTGIAPVAAVPLCKLYPNPATDQLMLQAPLDIVSVQVTDRRGIVVRHLDTKRPCTLYKFRVQDLSPGLYLLEVRLADERRAVMKFIKQ